MATPLPAIRHGSTDSVQQYDIRHVFRNEFGIFYDKLEPLKIETLELFDFLTTKRHADIDEQDEGPFHHEVLKNSIDLLHRFNRCAPLYPKMDAASDHRGCINKFFAKDIFCRVFCHDIEPFGNPRIWVDVFHFIRAIQKIWNGSLLGGQMQSGTASLQAAVHAPEEWAKASNRSRKNEVLWKLMGLTSQAIDRTGHTKHDIWCREAVIRVTSWRSRSENDESLFRMPISKD